MKKRLSIILCVCMLLSMTTFAAATEVPDGTVLDSDATAESGHYSYVDIVNQMLDLEHIALLPKVGEKGAMFSSYDRAARYDADSDTYISWNANGDATGCIERYGSGAGSGSHYLIADIDGPGVIWRIWTAGGNDGGFGSPSMNQKIVFCIDGDTYENPTFTKTFADLFNGNDADFFNFPGMSYRVAEGFNCYQPITYNESCKIYMTNMGGNRTSFNVYNHVTYSELPEGTTVESTTGALTTEQRAALKNVSDSYRFNIGENPNDLSVTKATVNNAFTVPAGGSSTVLNYNGDGAVAQFKVKLDASLSKLSPSEFMQVLKELTVSMYWDGEANPSVWAPLSDFFGSSTADEIETLPMGYTEDGGFYCYMYMPFKTGATIVLGNDGTVARNLSVDIAVVPLKADADDYLRFHAKWHRGEQDGTYAPLGVNRHPDETVLLTEGTGRFLGMSLHVYKATDSRPGSANPGYYWWGEGDEKFFVDGEKFPSTFGTGTEDYFGYAWCDSKLFSSPHMAQPYCETSGSSSSGYLNKGHKANVRFQLNDNVPFFTGFEASMERYYKDSIAGLPNFTSNTEYAYTVYWYLEAGGADPLTAKSLDARTNFYAPKLGISKDPIVFQGQALANTYTAGIPFNQSMTWASSWGWGDDSGSGNRRQLLWWNGNGTDTPIAEKPIGVGDSISFTFAVTRNFSGVMKIAVSKAADFGQHQLYLDGQPIYGVLESYNPKLTNTAYIVLGNVDLKKGEHTFTAEVVGKNEKSTNYYFALDTIVLDPILPEPGVIEGEDLEVLNITRGIVALQKMGTGTTVAPTFTYSRGKHLWWTNVSNNGATPNLGRDGILDLALNLPYDVDSEMVMYFTKAADYGIFQAYIDDVLVGEEFNLYNSSVVRSNAVSFGHVNLSAGLHKLTFKAVGSQRGGTADYMLGLDCIEFPDYNKPTHYSYVDIVNQMLDMEHTALLPKPGEKGAEWTSTDRRSTYNEETDTYTNWTANSDMQGFIERIVDNGVTRYLIADIEGPGVIWRFWTAQPNNGILEFCIDGDTYGSPTIVANMQTGMFEGGNDPYWMAYPELCYRGKDTERIGGAGTPNSDVSGRNCYIPITFNESIKIYVRGTGTSATSVNCYNMVNYTLLPEGSTVESLTGIDGVGVRTSEQAAALQKVNDFIANQMGENPNDLTDGTNLAGNFEVKAGETKTVVDYTGEGAVAEFKVKVTDDIGYEAFYDALQALTVSMYWDGEDKPSVWAPLGNFFGTPFGDYYITLPMGMRKDEWFYCYLYMPFATGAKIVIGNEGASAYNVSVDATVVPLKNPVSEYMRFHAKWHRGFYQGRSDRPTDYSVLRTEGQGRFLGFMQHIYEKGNHGWWGEGDEKFFVDGEKFPSSIGTGSEDYFGYAWCSQAIINERAFHAQPRRDGAYGNIGNVVNLRFQLGDNVPFFSSFDGYIEKTHNDNQVEYSEMPYWYLSVDGVDTYEPVPLEQRISFFAQPWLPTGIRMEAEDAAVISFEAATGNPAITVLSGASGPNQQVVAWDNTEVSEVISFTFDTYRTLDYALKFQGVYGPAYGIYQFALDGTDIGEPVDFYNSKNTSSLHITLGLIQLEKGTHTLSARLVGKNAASGGYLFALDNITLATPTNAKKLEFEDMTFVSLTGNGIFDVRDYRMRHINSSSICTFSVDQIWWTGGAVGDEIVLNFTLPETAKLSTIGIVGANGFGQFQLYIDGVPVGSAVDGRSSGGIDSLSRSLGDFFLAAGDHELKAVITGKQNAAAAYSVGLDYMTFVPAIAAEVVPTTIVNGYAANVKVNVDTSDLDADDVVTASLFGQELTVVNGTVLFKFVADEIPAAGVYTPVIQVNGTTISSNAKLTVEPKNDDIWTVTVIPDVEESKTVLGFIPVIAPKAGASFEVFVNNGKQSLTWDGGNTLVLTDCVVQPNDEIVIKNVKYPILFPSYSFTFSFTYTPQ